MPRVSDITKEYWIGLMPSLIIFIDGFPFRHLDQTSFIISLPHKKPLIPGIGYSVNIKAELFAGILPDQAGFFCEWGCFPKQSRVRASSLWDLLGQFRRWPEIDRALHKIINKATYVANIPFNYLRYFREIGKSVYASDFPVPTIFTLTDSMQMVLADTEPLPSPKRDEVAFLKTYCLIEQGFSNVFVSFVGLDSIAHRFGTQSPEYSQMVKKLDVWVQKLVVHYRQRWPESHIIILSDHGMSETHAGVDINLEMEKKIGKAGPETYLYFQDLTIMRVWIFNERLQPSIAEYLASKKEGQIISSEERTEFGITSRESGDFIYCLNDNLVFAPNFLGLKPTKAMHGYHPYLESQLGILLYQGEEKFDLPDTVRAKDFFHFAQRLLSSRS